VKGGLKQHSWFPLTILSSYPSVAQVHSS
jgi:hypothetical protein